MLTLQIKIKYAMQKYTVFHFTISPMSDVAADLLSASLAEVGFDSFEQLEAGVDAYVLTEDVKAEAVEQVLADFLLPDVRITYRSEPLVEKDWNEEWERESFHPIVIPGLCCIHKPETLLDEALAGAPRPEYDIRISPRMAFGTGTHETTSQLVELLLTSDFSGKDCLDMGCGTGILAICMALRGAASVTAIDIDEASMENTVCNSRLNQVANMDVVHGDASAISGEYDVIVANIHRNIIVHDLPTYRAHLKPGGMLLFSGFFTADVEQIEAAALAQGIEVEQVRSRQDWAVVQCRLKG